jgi:hypothetical protein
MWAVAWARLPLVPLLSVQPDTTTIARADITQIRRATKSAFAAHSKTGECSPVRAIALLALPIRQVWGELSPIESRSPYTCMDLRSNFSPRAPAREGLPPKHYRLPV